MARIRRLERVGARVHHQHEVDEVRELDLIHARAFVDAVARVKANAIDRQALDAVVDRLDVHLRAAAFLFFVEIIVDEDVRQKRIVDLQEESGVEVLFFGLVVLVLTDDAARADRGHEHHLGARLGRRRLQISDIAIDRRAPLVLDWSDTGLRHELRDHAAHHRFFEIAIVVLGKLRRLFGPP